MLLPEAKMQANRKAYYHLSLILGLGNRVRRKQKTMTSRQTPAQINFLYKVLTTNKKKNLDSSQGSHSFTLHLQQP